MTISRANGAGWGVGDKLTSAQINTIDINTTYGLDNRAGQTATLASIVSCSGAGRLIPTFVAGSDSNASYTAGGGNQVINASSGITANRTYTLQNTSAVAGDLITVLGNASFDITVNNAAASTLIVLGTGNTGTNQSRWADFVYNGSAWILLRSSFGPQLLRQVFTGNGNYTVPADCYRLIVFGCGGGGGGGGGGNLLGSSTTQGSAGGGGGGGALMGVHFVNTTPGTVIAVTIGSAGGGGIAAANGSDGTATTFGSILSFLGGQGGSAGTGGAVSSQLYSACPGGGPMAGAIRQYPVTWNGTIGYVANTLYPFDPTGAGTLITGSAIQPPGGQMFPGQGGTGRNNFGGSSGNSAFVLGTTGGSNSVSGGAGGSVGADGGGGHKGGGGGGGGGASTFGSGGNGGAGGAGNSAGAGTVGGTGSSGTAGSGGGGGGGGGNSSVPSGGAGGPGGTGGSGILVVVPVR